MSGGRNRRKAALPAAGYTRPASLDASGLVVTVFAENGEVEGVFDFGRLPGGLELRRSLAAALDQRSGPGGTWRSGSSARAGYYAARAFLAHADGLPEPPRSIQDITPGTWASWRMSLPANNYGADQQGRMRQLLLTVPELSVATAKALGRRIGARSRPTVASYSIEDFDAIRRAAARTFTAALHRIRRNRDHLRRWYAGGFPDGSNDFLIGEALDSVLRTGDVPLVNLRTGARSVRVPYRRALGGGVIEQTWARLFLTPEEGFALAVLLVASEGWNRSVLHRMTVPDHDPALGEEFAIHLVEVHKARRPVRLRYTTNNLVDAGVDSPGRLMSRAIEATELARQTLELLGTPTDRLLVSRYRSPAASLFHLGVPTLEITRTRGHRGALLHDKQGQPVAVSLQRLRRTVQVRIRRQPGQNSVRTHESTYVLPDPATREDASGVIAQGLADAVDHARAVTTIKMVLGDDAEVLTELADHPDLARAVLSGRLDTATAACTDYRHSPVDEPGQPCTASFLLCLACPNAVATRRHLPRLVYLHRALEQLRATLDTRIWDLDWREHHDRLSSLLSTHTTPAEQDAAVRGISDHDRTLVDDVLRRRFDL